MSQPITQSHSAAAFVKPLLRSVRASFHDAAAFMYGDETRTRRTLLFAYGCIGVYMLAVINAPSFGACAL